MANKSITEQLIKNNLLLLKKTTELLKAVNQLTNKMDKMVTTFTKAAEYIEKEGAEETSPKLIELLEQNKKVAKGLLMLERYVREKSAFTPSKL